MEVYYVKEVLCISCFKLIDVGGKFYVCKVMCINIMLFNFKVFFYLNVNVS